MRFQVKTKPTISGMIMQEVNYILENRIQENIKIGGRYKRKTI